MPGIGNDTLRRLSTQLRRAERGEFDREPLRSKKHVPKSGPPRVVMLLEDCESGDVAECAILIEVESTETQIVEIQGTPTAGTFMLEFQGERTTALSYDITAAQMQAELEALGSINPGDVIVEMGPGASLGSRKIHRWLVSFTGQYEGNDVAEMIPRNVDLTIQGWSVDVEAIIEVRSLPDLEDTGDTLRAKCVVPLPPGITIHAGAIGLALPVPSFGYCLWAIECFDCDTY